MASDGWSGFPTNRGLLRKAKFAVARRETHKYIASFKETKYDFFLYRHYFFIRLLPSGETDDFITEKFQKT